MRNRLTRAVAFTAAVAWVTSTALAQQPPPGQTHDHDAHHHEMLQRGAQAMGFDQECTIHHFLLYEDGGAIEVSVKEARDADTSKILVHSFEELSLGHHWLPSVSSFHLCGAGEAALATGFIC
jgi:hypothetical protein